MAEGATKKSALALLTGALWAVLTVIGFLVAGKPPDADEPIGKVVKYWIDHDNSSMLGAVLEALGAVALIFFAASLYRVLRKHDVGAGVLSIAALGGAIVAAAGIGVDASLRFTLADQVKDVPPSVTQTINALWADFFFPMVIGLGVLILATSWLAIHTRVIPVWLAWIGVVIFIALFTPAGFFAAMASALWILVVSIILWRRESAETSAPVGAPA